MMQMPKRVKDIAGNTYGRLKVISYEGLNKFKVSLWKCLCECGNYTTVAKSDLLPGHTVSCGCKSKEHQSTFGIKHGLSRVGNKTYKSWECMRSRCNNSNHKNYKYYGGRGIVICERWNSFENFLEDMGERPEGKTLDRIKVNGNYEPNNCKWSTYKEQSLNKRPLNGTKSVSL